MKTTLDYKEHFLCVLAQYEVLHGHARTLVKEWYPVRQADEAEVRTLLDRPLTETDPDEGTYVDEEGNVFQLAEKGATKAIEVERSSAEQKEVGNGLDVVLSGEERTLEESKVVGGKAKKKARLKTRRGDHALLSGFSHGRGAHRDGKEKNEQESPATEPITFAQLNLRQKLAVVRRRIAYVQKRGHNQRHNYNYVTAADIAGAVGDILAELGVVVVPRLESISHEAVRSSGSGTEHATHVVMSYSFLDVDTAEEITVKTAGEGLDSGDKAPYKAMTGALKYTLLQSFLLATGDDPEEERVSPTNHSSPTHESHSKRLITVEEVRELGQLIADTGTELERVLAYYKLASLEEMTEGTYRRALELLQRKRATQVRREATHAQN
jgi:ERF superfamily